jgi:acyl-CoA thioester hydrolase
VRFRDCDLFGHVNNAVYLTYFEMSRMAYWFAASGSRDISELDLIVASASCRYISAAAIGEQLGVYCRLTHLGRSSFTLAYKVHVLDSRRLVATGETALVAYDYRRRRPKRLSAAKVEAICAIEGMPPVDRGWRRPDDESIGR